MPQLAERMDALHHWMYSAAQEVAREAARCVVGRSDEDDVVDVLGAIAEDFEPTEYAELFAVCLAAAEMTHGGQEAAAFVYSAGRRVAEEAPVDGEGRGYLFAIPVKVWSTEPVRHLSKAFTRPQIDKVTASLRELDMVANGRVSLFPRLMSPAEVESLELGDVYLLKTALLGGSTRAAVGVVKAALAAAGALTKQWDALAQAEAAGKFKLAAIVGFVDCDDRFDPPCPLTRATELAHDDLPEHDDETFDALHEQLHDESARRTEPFEAELRGLLRADDVDVIYDARVWHDALEQMVCLPRELTLQVQVQAAKERWQLGDEDELSAGMPQPCEGGMTWVLESSRGDAQKLFWPQLPGEETTGAAIDLMRTAVGAGVAPAIPAGMEDFLKAVAEKGPPNGETLH